MNRNGVLSATFLCLVLGLFSSFSNSQELETNWHNFRGPDGNGVSENTNPPVNWSGTSDNLKWKVEIPGQGSSSPIVWGNKIFLMTAVDTKKTADGEAVPKQPEAQGGGRSRGRGRGRGRSQPTSVNEFHVVCLNRNDGSVAWQTKVNEAIPHEGKHSTNTFASGSPITDGKHVYVTFGSYGVYCLDMEGNVVWERDLGKMTTRNSFGEGVSPALYENTLVINWDHEGQSFIEAMDATTGETKWKKDRSEATGWATPLIVNHDGRTQVIVNASTVRSYDLADGSAIWECGGQTGNPIPTPMLDGEMVICMTGFRSSACYAIPLASEGDISGSDKIAWNSRDIGPYVPTGVLYKGTLYATKGSTAAIAALDSKTGEVVMGATRIDGIKALYSSMVAAKDKIFVTGRGGTTVVLQHGGEFKILASNDLGEPVDATPALVENQIIIRGANHLFCFENE